MNYAVKNARGEWEVLRLYDFMACADVNGHTAYTRRAQLETDADTRFLLADVPLPDGILRVDMAWSPADTELRLGHYSLPRLDRDITETTRDLPNKTQATIMDNGQWQLAMVPLLGWDGVRTVRPAGLHPMADSCAVSMAHTTLKAGSRKTLATLMLWKRSGQPFTDQELMPVRQLLPMDGRDEVFTVLYDDTPLSVDYRNPGAYNKVEASIR